MFKEKSELMGKEVLFINKNCLSNMVGLYPLTPVVSHKGDIAACFEMGDGVLTCSGLLTPYGDIKLGQHWLMAPGYYLNWRWFIISEIQ